MSSGKKEFIDNHSFAEVLRDLETDPYGVVDRWSSAIEQTSHISDLRKQSLLRQAEKIRLVIARNKLSAAVQKKCLSRLSTIEDLLSIEQTPAGSAQALADAFLEGVSKVFADPVAQDGGPEEFSAADTRDLYQMEEVARSWGAQDFIRWAKRGYERIKEQRGSVIRAFAPIRLLPGGDPEDQFAFAFSIAKQIHLTWPNRLLSAVLELLETRKFANLSELEFHRDLWDMISRVTPHASMSTTAIRYLIQREKAPAPVELNRSIIDAAVAAVSSSRPFTSTQLVFFRWLHERTHLWESKYWANYINCWIGTQKHELNQGLPIESVQESWQFFVDEYLRPLSGFLDARKHEGQFFLYELTSLLGENSQSVNTSSYQAMKKFLLKVDKQLVNTLNEEQAELLAADAVESSEKLREALAVS